MSLDVIKPSNLGLPIFRFLSSLAFKIFFGGDIISSLSKISEPDSHESDVQHQPIIYRPRVCGDILSRSGNLMFNFLVYKV
jgi:hypothetical protein